LLAKEQGKEEVGFMRCEEEARKGREGKYWKGSIGREVLEGKGDVRTNKVRKR
jgi:hypothetical protein